MEPEVTATQTNLPSLDSLRMNTAQKTRVLEIGNYSAAYCGRLWVRTGADVVQVESQNPPPGWVSAHALQTFTDRGKRRTKAETPTELAHLSSQADVVICEAATADELLALGFDEWKTPVKVAITPFGLTGPKRNWRATPNVLLAMGGYTNVIGDPNRPPLNLPGYYTEFQAGALGFATAQAAHFAGGNDRIDLGMLEVLASLHQYTTVRYHADGQIRERRGSDLWFVVPSNLFACKDGSVYLTITPSFWEMFVLLLDRPELTLDERFENNDVRMINRDALHEIISESFSKFTCAELETKAQEFRVPLGVAQTPTEVLEDVHLAVRSFWESVEVPEYGHLRSPGLPWRGRDNIAAAPTESLPPPELCDWAEVW